MKFYPIPIHGDRAFINEYDNEIWISTILTEYETKNNDIKEIKVFHKVSLILVILHEFFHYYRDLVSYLTNNAISNRSLEDEIKEGGNTLEKIIIGKTNKITYLEILIILNLENFKKYHKIPLKKCILENRMQI